MNEPECTMEDYTSAYLAGVLDHAARGGSVADVELLVATIVAATRGLYKRCQRGHIHEGSTSCPICRGSITVDQRVFKVVFDWDADGGPEHVILSLIDLSVVLLKNNEFVAEGVVKGIDPLSNEMLFDPKTGNGYGPTVRYRWWYEDDLGDADFDTVVYL